MQPIDDCRRRGYFELPIEGEHVLANQTLSVALAIFPQASISIVYPILKVRFSFPFSLFLDKIMQ